MKLATNECESPMMGDSHSFVAVAEEEDLSVFSHNASL